MRYHGSVADRSQNPGGTQPSSAPATIRSTTAIPAKPHSQAKERQHAQRDHREARQCLDVMLVEPLDKAVQFLAQGQDEHGHRGRRDRQAALPSRRESRSPG